MSETGPETEVISCPACDNLLRVPPDLLGQQVQCPECRAMFRAPVRDPDGRLTDPELISRPTPPPGEPRKLDAMLLLPAFGLLLCGVAGLVVNARLSYVFHTDMVAAKDYALRPVFAMREVGLTANDPGPEQDRRDDEMAGDTVAFLRWVLPTAAGVSALTFLGGLSIALRWNRRLAQLGCVAAMVNVPHLCCVPGGVAGLWGLVMLAGEEGRAHFMR